MPPANACPTAGTVPVGVEKVPSEFHTITTGSSSSVRVNANWIVSGPVAVAENASGTAAARGVNFTCRLPSSMLNEPPPRSWAKLLASIAIRAASNPLTVPSTMVHS